MLKSTIYSTFWYTVSAAVFLSFTVLFMRQFGAAAYGDFSIMLNSLSALLLLGNYHGYLVSYSVATNRAAFHRYLLRAVLPYVAVMVPVATTIFATVTDLRPGLAMLAGAMFALLLLCGMPTAVIMATQHNWRVNAYRAAYQVALVTVFWPLFAGSHNTQLSFLLATLVGAALSLALLLLWAERELQSAAAEPPPSASILAMAAIGNISITLTLLADKFALRHLSVGGDRQLAGLYMLYYDVLTRASAIYVIIVCPLTYLLLDRQRRNQPVGGILLRLTLGAAAIGMASLLVGYVAMPLLYQTEIAQAPLLPLFMAAVVAGQSLSSVIGAYYGAIGRGDQLMRLNSLILIVVMIGIASLEWSRIGGFSITELAFVLALGYALNALMLIRIVFFKKEEIAQPAAPAGDGHAPEDDIMHPIARLPAIDKHPDLDGEAETASNPPLARPLPARAGQIRAVLGQLEAGCRGENFCGWDPFDGLNSPLCDTLPFRRSRLLRLAWLQACKRSPVNPRPLLGVPKTENAKAIALFAQGFGLLGEGAEQQALLTRLIALRSGTGDAAAWGYPFPWQARAFYVPRNTPNVVCTAYAVQAIAAASPRDDPAAAAIILAAARFIERELVRRDGRGWRYIAYAPGTDTVVHNANLWGAYVLAEAQARGGPQVLMEIAEEAVSHTLAAQEADGGWRYGTRSHHGFVDGFHTGYMICALDRIAALRATGDYDGAIRRALDFYSTRFFAPDGAPAYYAHSPWPLDCHSGAQAIITFLTVRRSPERDALADRVAGWLVDTMWLPEQGRFLYQRSRFGANRVPYMRWTQAWMFLALATWLKYSFASGQ